MNICFVTEIDIDRKIGGAITNDLKTISCLRKLSNVDTIHLQIQKYKSVYLALPLFILQIFRSSSRHYDAFFSRGLFASFFLILTRPLHRKKVIHNALSVPFPSIEAKYSNRNKPSAFIWYTLMRFLEKVVTSNADIVVVAADSYANLLLRSGVKAHAIKTVPFYVEAVFFQQPLKLSKEGKFTFCYIGAFHPYHDLLPVIEAFEHLSKKDADIEFNLVGEGPQMCEIEREVSRRRLTQKIRFLGRVPHSSIAGFLSGVDSCVILTSYGLSTNLLEAAAAGKAIITLKRKDDHTLERYFRHQKEILYVNDASPQKIAEAMRLVSEDPEIRGTLSSGARRVAKQYFSEEACLSQLQELTQKISVNHPQSRSAI